MSETIDIINSLDETFYRNLEKLIGFGIPEDIKKILKLNYYNSCIIVSKIGDQAIEEIQNVIIGI